MVNVAQGVWDNADSRPDAVAIRSDGVSWTYEELRTAAARFAGTVESAGIRPQDRVILIAPSVAEFAVAYYGLQAIGAIAITMNTQATVREIGYIVADSQASMIIAWHSDTKSAREAAAADDVPFRTIEDDARNFEGPPIESPRDVADGDTAVILYTSGTTGQPKGAELTASNLNSTSGAFMDLLELDAEDRFGTGLPLFHVFGQAVVMNSVLRLGASLSLLHPFDPAKMLQMMKDDGLTAIAGVPTMWNAMLHASEGYTAEDFMNLRSASSGGASLPGEVVREFNSRFGCEIKEGYGLTETCGAATTVGVDREPKIGAVGTNLPGTQVEARDLDAKPVAVGEVGEIFLKGPTVMKGYWGRPEATAAELQDGWLKTGDLGTIDEDGDVRIIDRAKDLIIRGGYNVYPREVEEVLYEHPDIVEVAIIGVPDEHYGEEIAAVVALRPGAALTGEELRTWAKEQLSAYKVPRLVQFVDVLPKGATGKILKRAIDREPLSEQAAKRRAAREEAQV